MSESDGSGDLVSKVVISVLVALVVGVVAAVSEVDAIVAVIAVLGAVAGFWLLDSLLRPAPPAPTFTAGGGVLPSTSADSLPPPRGVEAPTISEPAAAGDEPVVDEQHNARLDPALFDPASVEIKTSSHGAGRVYSIRVAKHGNSIAECEDAVIVDPRRAVLAVADGASSSFGAHLWAATLTKHFVTQPPTPLSVGSFSTWLADARSASPEPGGQGEGGDNPNGWWSEQGARQGAYSTIVGAVIKDDGDDRVATIMCLGDSCAFVLTGAPGDRVVRRSLPYEDPSQFGSHPSLLGSMTDRRHDEPSWTTIPTGSGDLLVLASDAVSEWLLGDPKRFQLFDGDDVESIAGHLIAERTDGRIVNDDVTVAVFELAT